MLKVYTQNLSKMSEAMKMKRGKLNVCAMFSSKTCCCIGVVSAVKLVDVWTSGPRALLTKTCTIHCRFADNLCLYHVIDVYISVAVTYFLPYMLICGVGTAGFVNLRPDHAL